LSLFAVFALFAGYTGLSPRISGPVYRPLLFHPHVLPNDYSSPTLEGIKGEDVRFGSDRNLDLYGSYYNYPHSKFVVLLSHGNGGNISVRPKLIEALLSQHLSVFIYDYCGYGKSAGQPDVENICGAALSAYAYLVKERGYKPNQIVLYGESLGAAVSTYLASREPIAALILQSGFTSLRSIAIEKFAWLGVYPDWLFPKPPLDTLQTLPGIKVPVLIIHGGQDSLVPIHHGEALFAAANQPKFLLAIPDAHHSDFYEFWRPDVERAFAKLIETLSEPGTPLSKTIHTDNVPINQ
jgi:pimeloyl-ACP methyl ester carboxylesterase